MNIVIKRIVAFLLMIFIFMNTTVVQTVKAHALPVYDYPVFEVIDGGGGVVSSGPTAGGLLAIVGGLIAAVWQVDLIVDNWDMFVDYLGDMARFGGDWASRLWDQISGIFVHKSTGKTLGQAVVDGDDINYYDYYAPEGVGHIELDINHDMMLHGAEALSSAVGIDTINPDASTLVGRVQMAIEKHAIKNDPRFQPFAFNRPEWLAYENIVLLYDDYSSYLRFLCWDNLPGKGLKTYVVGDYLFVKSFSGSLIDMYSISFRTDSYGEYSEKKNEYVSYNTAANRIGTYNEYINLGKYGTSVEMLSAIIPFDLIQQNLMLYNTPLNIDASRYDVDAAWQNGISININDYLVQELEKLGGLDRLTSTDDLMQVMEKADARARENYDRILPGTVTDTKAPGLNIPILSDIWEWLQNIWEGFINACKSVLEWAFVPSAGAVDEFVIEAKQIIEGNSNILTYPVEIVIVFLNKVLTMTEEDCVLVFPSISFMGRQLYGGYTFNFTTHIKRSEFASLYSSYKMIVSAFMIIWVLNSAIKKGDRILGGN